MYLVTTNTIFYIKGEGTREGRKFWRIFSITNSKNKQLSTKITISQQSDLETSKYSRTDLPKAHTIGAKENCPLYGDFAENAVLDQNSFSYFFFFSLREL